MFNNKKTQKRQKIEENAEKRKGENWKNSVIYILKLHAQGWESHI